MRLDDGRGNWVELHIVGYQFPDFDWRRGTSDANWLMIEGEAAIDGRVWRFQDPSLTTFDAAWLANWLDRAAQGEGKGELGFDEPNLAFGLLSDRQGIHVRLGYESRPPWIADSEGAEVSIAVGGNQLTSAAAAIRSELQPFPMRGPVAGGKG
jgi:hypothetical protein